MDCEIEGEYRTKIID